MDLVTASAEISQIISQELICLEKVIELIEQENSAIKASKSTELHEILVQKQPYLSQLQQLDQQRSHILTCHGLTPSPESFKMLMEEINDEQLSATWEQVQAQIRQCKSSNEVNGRLIHMRKNTNESILKILLGNRHASTQTYSSSGATGSYAKTGLSAVA